ncbi:hypothetical protein HQ602_03945 [Rhodococcus kroppenstedtii]|uniref:hypothetical protein n=1 Tax=Rhodococcoides kroppenstedtii TaxID=293050 RepID=UPI001C9B2B82|nr:hypothetical protein [Rhodococcus kroppenstedtii]MBY6435529.1 hypothetical protein [Rhodococcus kroppenstedtii]
MFESILARDGEERAATEHLRDGLARASDPHRFRDYYYDTAVVKLGDAHARHLLSATLPTAIHTAATGQRGWDAAVAGVRDVLARGVDRNMVIDLLGDPDLHTARNVPVAILARLETVEVPENGSTLPVLPPEHPGADSELRAFAENTVAAIVDPRGADTQWATDLDYTHPQQQAYRNAMHALVDADALTAVRRAVPERVAAALTDREWADLARRVVDTALGADPDTLDLHLTRFDDAERDAIRAVVADVAETVTGTDPDLTAYTDELRTYLGLTDGCESTAPAADPVDAGPRSALGERPELVRTPAHADLDVAAAAEQMRRNPIRALDDDRLGAAAAQTRTRLAGLDRDVRLAAAAKTAALGGKAVAAAREDIAQTMAAAKAVQTAVDTRARAERAQARLAAARASERAAREPEMGRFGRRTVDQDRLAAATAETALWSERARSAAAAAGADRTTGAAVEQIPTAELQRRLRVAAVARTPVSGAAAARSERTRQTYGDELDRRNALSPADRAAEERARTATAHKQEAEQHLRDRTTGLDTDRSRDVGPGL